MSGSSAEPVVVLYGNINVLNLPQPAPSAGDKERSDSAKTSRAAVF